jgi:protein ImuB
LGHEPLEAPARQVHFTVLEAVPGYGAQRDFFGRKEEEAEQWDSLVGRLSHKLGKQRVFVAQAVDRYLPEESWVRKLELERGLLSYGVRGTAALQPAIVRPDRPSRLLEEPLPLQRVGALLRNPETGHRWRILDWDGPERLSGEWWKSESLDGFHRDYYQVKTESGERLWVFVRRDPEGNARVHLHGYFD